jgi:hypothetical protein
MLLTGLAGQWHMQYGFHFVLPHDVPEAPGTQKDWRFCFKCGVMYYAGDPRGYKGMCPGGGGHEHDPHLFNFVLPHTADFYEPPPIVQPTAPHIDVAYSSNGPTFTVTGNNFLANHPVYVRVVDDPTFKSSFFQTQSNGSGYIAPPLPITIPVLPSQSLTFTANDGRPDPNDRTGTLWSNPVTIKVD